MGLLLIKTGFIGKPVGRNREAICTYEKGEKGIKLWESAEIGKNRQHKNGILTENYRNRRLTIVRREI